MQRRTKTDPYTYITQTIKNNFPKNCRVFCFEVVQNEQLIYIAIEI